MKVCLNDSTGNLLAMSRHLVAEGDVLVPKPSDAELTIGTGGVNAFHPVPKVIVDSCVPNYVPLSTHTTEFIVSKWYDKSFSSQLLVGICLNGLMDGGRGAPAEVGLASRFVTSDNFSLLFESEMLREFLDGLRYKGFVSFRFVGDKVVGVETGIPYNGIYNVLEGVKGRISEFFIFGGRVMESWTVQTLVTRAPFPYSDVSEKVEIVGVTPSIERHVYLFNTQHVRKSLYTTGTKLAVCTAWDEKVWKAAELVQRTCESFRVPNVQYRTDIADVVRSKWGHIEKLL